EEHDEHDQPCLVTAARLQHDFAQPVRDPGIHQRLADDEDGGNQEHHRVTKARQCLLWREHATHHERQDHEDRHDIGAWTSPGKQSDGAGQDAEDQQHLSGHGRASGAETAAISSARIGTLMWWHVPSGLRLVHAAFNPTWSSCAASTKSAVSAGVGCPAPSVARSSAMCGTWMISSLADRAVGLDPYCPAVKTQLL